MSIYYVSNLGCDTNDGLTPETAWQTIPKVNEAIAAGDTVKLRCGDTFYGRIQLKPGESMENPTTISSYGDGKKPTVSQYKIINADGWEKHEDGVWKIDLSDTSKFTGNTCDFNNNAGFLLISGEVHAWKKFHLEDIANQWDFYSDEEKYVYVKSDKCPSEYSDDIRIACCINCVPFRDNIKVENIVFTGTGAHGINGIVHGAHIKNCEFHNLGGSRLGGIERKGKFNTTRYGNGVECWTGSTDVTVEDCKFSGIYDVAFTMQGPANGQCWKNVHVRNCEMWNNSQCFEIWASDGEEGTGFVNCSFENNTCLNSGYCWGYDTRPNKHCACHLLVYAVTTPLCDITVKNNLFYNARPSTIYKSGGPAELAKDYNIVDNIIVMDESEDIIYRNGCDEETYNEFYKMIASKNKILTKNRFMEANNDITW